MNQLITVLSESILNQIENNNTNIVRIEGVDSPVIYKGVCEKIKKESLVDVFIPKLTKEKYDKFAKADKDEWNSALIYLHQGNNAVYSISVNDAYAENSYVDFSNAITKWRNESANISKSGTTLILLMGTEDAPDTGGLADTSFVISPREIIAALQKDYSVWFSNVIERNSITEDYKMSIHTLYRALFSQLTTDIFQLSDFVDSLYDLEFNSVQEIIAHICETLSDVWGIPSIINKKYVPKVSALNKGTLSSAKIITSAVKFIERSDDIPTASAIRKLKKKFARYADENDIDTTAPFPEDVPVFANYDDFEKTVIDFMRGIDLDVNRKTLLSIDFSIINAIIGTKLPTEPKEKVPTFTGVPVEVYSRMFIDAARSFHDEYNCYPSKFSIGVERISLSDCTDDQKADSFLNICCFLGGILDFFNEVTIDVAGKLLQFEYTNMDCDDPFDFSNYDSVSAKIKSSGKWGDPCKIQFMVLASNEDKTHKYGYKWVFSPYSAWTNAFSYLADIMHSSGTSYQLPTLVACPDLQEYLDCESEEEFFVLLQQFKGYVLFEEHKNEIRRYFPENISALFAGVCNNFKAFALKVTDRGLFNARNDLRKLVNSYTMLMKSLYDNFSTFTDVQREKLSLIINCFVISSNSNIISNCDVGNVIVPAYNPIVLEKLDAQQLFLRRGFAEIYMNMMSGNVSDITIRAKLDELVQLSSITQAADLIRRKAEEYLTCKNMWDYFGVYFRSNQENELLLGSNSGPAIVSDDDDASSMLGVSPASNIIVRNVMDYVRTFPARVDGLNITFIAPTDMQHIVSAVHSIAKLLDNEDAPATMNIRIICLNSKKNVASYLTRWLDSYFNGDKIVKVNTYLYNGTVHSKDDISSLENILNNGDLCFTYNILQSSGVQFDVAENGSYDINHEKFPMTFIPDTIPATHGKSRRVNMSQFQFYAAMQHTQISHIVGYPHSTSGLYRVYKTLELPDVQEAIISLAHKSCKWVVCIDQAIDRHMLEESDSKIIGFTTGEGSYGELNVTVSARKDILIDIKQMLRSRITEKFMNWDSNRLQKAADYCVDELSQYMDGSRILKALNPYDYEIHSFLAYILTLQMLGLTRTDSGYIVRSLISLDSYRHWFAEDCDLSQDNKRPDFMLIEIPFTEENITAGRKLKIKAKIIECKMGYQNEAHLAKAKTQLEKGLKIMGMNWRPSASGVMHRYWLNQLYRAIIFSPLNMDNTSPEYKVVREKIYGILNGEYELEWTGDIFAFWLDVNSEQPEEWDIISDVPAELFGSGVVVNGMKCHNCGQMFIQKMLLPPEERKEEFSYNAISVPDPNDSDDEEPDVAIVEDGNRIPTTKAVDVLHEDVQSNEITVPSEVVEEPEHQGKQVPDVEKIRVLIGKDKRNTDVYWEFGHKLLGNRHILITGSSGQGKTYGIQTMLLELARQNISSVIFDYTDGFLPNKLEPEFIEELGTRMEQRVALIHKIPVNPFVLRETEIPPFGRIKESAVNVAGRLADILKHVYSFGDQQRAAIYSACKDGIDKYKDQMSFAKLRELLEESSSKEAKGTLNKMTQFFDQDLFDTEGSFDWREVTSREGKITVIQLTGLDRYLQTVITEITLWDAWYSLTKFGDKDNPFVVVLDEAQNLSFQKESPAEKILREGRKYGWSAWFATQFLKGALDSGEISNLQQAAERLYFKPSGEEMTYVASQIAGDKAAAAEWLNTVKNLQKGQCIVQGDRIKPNGQFGAAKPVLVNVSCFKDRTQFNGRKKQKEPPPSEFS